jgi:hypothetical protein
MYDTCRNSQKHNILSITMSFVSQIWFFLDWKEAASLLTTYTGDYVYHMVQLQ